MTLSTPTATTPPRARGVKGGSRRVQIVRRGLIGCFALLAIGEILVRVGVVSSAHLPPPSVVVTQVFGLAFNVDFLGHVWATLLAALVGLAIAAVIAIPLGVFLGSIPVAYRASQTIIELMRPIPSIALLPLVLLLFGTGTEMKIALIVYAGVWPMLFNAIYGTHDVDPVAKDTARTFNFSEGRILATVSLPHAAPFIFTGVRLSAALALVLAISAELLAGGRTGIGTWMIQINAIGGRPDLLYAAVLISGLLGLGLNGMLSLIEKRLMPWEQEGAR